jgi:TrmH family RNA methyltransferase
MDTPAPDFVVTSLQNSRVKEAIKLRKRTVREETGLFLIEGYRETRRAVENGIQVNSFFYCPSLFQGANEPAVLADARARGADLTECSEPVFRKMAYRDRPEGLLAVAVQRRWRIEEVRLPAAPLVVVAEGIEKPGNLGSILRSADAAGADAVLVPDAVTDPYNPNAVRASIGTLFTVPVVCLESAEGMRWLRERGVQIVAATPAATVAFTEADLTGPTAIVVGTEQVGLSRPWLEAADCRVRIPMHGQADSLNVANAATLLLFEAVRQRGDG